MKFCKQLEFYKIPEWSEYYFNYAYIKKILKRLTKKLKTPNKSKKDIRDEIATLKPLMEENDNLIKLNGKQQQPQNDNFNLINLENQSSIDFSYDLPKYELFINFSNEERVRYFIIEYKRQIQIIQKFYFQKIKEYKENFEKLKIKIHNQNETLKIENIKENKIPQEETEQNKERDELGYAVSFKRAMSNIYNQTSWLHSYHSTNFLAIQKIQKKAKKKMHKIHIDEIDSYLEETDKQFSFFTSLDMLINLRKEIKNFYSNQFTQNNIKQASNELDSRLKGTKIKYAKIIFFGFGIIFACNIFFILLEFMKPKESKALAPFFPAFNFSLVMIEALIGVAGNIIILRKYGINYVYIFEIDPERRLGFGEILQNGIVLLSIWMIMLLFAKVTLYFKLFWEQIALFALLIILSLIIFIFFPFHCSYYYFRKGIIQILVKNLFPIGKNGVRFRDFLFGDILTSLNKPFASLILSFCLISNKKSRVEDIRASCNRDSYGCLIVLFAPFAIRFFQCINRYYYTREAWPHLGNTFKYVGGLSNAIFGWYYGFANKSRVALILHLIFGILSQSYMLFWDIYMDWNLGRIKTKNFFLRDKIVYPKKMYYSAIVIDGCLRFCWLLNLVNTSSWIDDEWKNLFFAMLEAYRRIQWCIFRIENENTNNPEKYRAILDIPALPVD